MCLPAGRSPKSSFLPKPDPKEGRKGDEGLARWEIQAWGGSVGCSIPSTCL